MASFEYRGTDSVKPGEPNPSAPRQTGLHELVTHLMGWPMDQRSEQRPDLLRALAHTRTQLPSGAIRVVVFVLAMVVAAVACADDGSAEAADPNAGVSALAALEQAVSAYVAAF